MIRPSVYDRNRDFTAAQQAEGAKLSALIEQGASDPKLEAVLKTQGYWQDGVGHWFHKDQLVPPPPPASLRGIGVLAFAADK